ncbi:X-ray repair cross-complementing protein 5 [Condylostylus longicornis]|uniref:X-ray repair cross-complementing protein 5 n=1 Tax=Condylostylus longicornis TaxID=2530218 RepID=UPI00244E289E|nr:X-ray repair cross-complementing protein 5 [Condylostylus longicornis]
MAQTKEGVIVILDVSKKTREKEEKAENTFFEKQKECCIKFLQQKIFVGKKDEVAFVLLGAENTDNELNINLGGYDNIVEAFSMQIPSWTMLTSIVNSIDQEKGSETADWMDSLVVALDILKREESKRFKYLKIILFHQFLYPIDESNSEAVIERLKETNVDLVIISNYVKYKDDPTTNIVKPFFSSLMEKTEDQIMSEKLARSVLDQTDGVLCNFDIALSRMSYGLKPKGRPWFWYSTLDIGTKIKIHIGVTISIKSETLLQFKTQSAKPHSISWLATEYFQNGEKMKMETESNISSDSSSFSNEQAKKQFAFEELIDGYMLGSTAVPYEKSLPTTKQGMQCIGFTQKSNVLPQYIFGSATYLVFAKQTMETSVKMMDALVKALNKNNMVMIGRRVYRDGLRPKFVALFPNTEQKYPCLTLFELYCSEQHVNWQFAPLKSKRTEPTEEQYKAIDDLMDAMDLDDDLSSNGEVRDCYEKSLLPLNNLPNVANEYICQVATERIIEETKEITLSLRGRDNILNVPEKVYKKTEEPLERIKELFPLEEIKKEIKKELIRHVGNIDSHEVNNDIEIERKPLEYKKLISIGTVTPAEDFKKLIKSEVEDLGPEKLDQKTPIFDKLTRQIQEVLKDLIFKTISLQYEKITNTLKMYRDEAAQYNPYDFNDFIREIKAIAINRKMHEFWNDVVVKNQLGLLSSKDCNFFNELDDVKDINEFYKINVEKQIDTTENEGNIDDLFNDM